MELRQMIEIGNKKVGSQADLAKVIGVAANTLTDAKAGRRGLPAEACGRLADIIEADRWAVLAASNLVTERNEEKRAYWRSFVEIAEPEMKTPHLAGGASGLVGRVGVEPTTNGLRAVIQPQILVNDFGIFQVHGRRQMGVTPDHGGALPAAHFLHGIERHAVLH